MMSDHRHAASRWAHDRIERMKDAKKCLGQGAGFLGAAGIRHRLPAAGLGGWELDLKLLMPLAGPFATVFFQDLRRRQTHLGKKLVDVARNKQTNSHEYLFVASMIERIVLGDYRNCLIPLATDGTRIFTDEIPREDLKQIWTRVV
jgi:hypothetical protein